MLLHSLISIVTLSHVASAIWHKEDRPPNRYHHTSEDRHHLDNFRMPHRHQNDNHNRHFHKSHEKSRDTIGYQPHRFTKKFKSLDNDNNPVEINQKYYPDNDVHFPNHRENLGGYKKHESGFHKSDFFPVHKRDKHKHGHAHYDHHNAHSNEHRNLHHHPRRHNRDPMNTRQRHLQKQKIHDYLSHKEDSGEVRSKLKESRSVDLDRSYGITSVEAASVGYDRDILYKGGNVWTNDIGQRQAYKKGEAYKKRKYSGDHNEADYSGKSHNIKRKTKLLHQVKYDVGHESDYGNNFTNQDHGGEYKGQIFNVGFEAKNVEGGFYGQKSKRKYEDKAKDHGKYKGEALKGGHIRGGDRIEYGDYSNDGDFEEFPQKNPRFRNGMANGGFGVIPDARNGRPKKGEIEVHSHVKSKRKRPSGSVKGGKFSQEGDFRNYGAHFSGKDFIGKEHETEDQVGLKQAHSARKEYTHGSYKDIQAKGFNKNVEFEGDYKKNEKRHDVQRKARHGEKFFEFEEPFPYEIRHEEYTKDYKGKTYKGHYDEDGKYGKFEDKELQSELDNNRHKLKYVGDSYANGFSGETQGIFYTGNKKNANDEETEYNNNYILG